MGIDLHLHSRYSDGALEPKEIVERALTKGITALALTDHDTIEGNAAMAAACGEAGIAFTPGIEVSVSFRDHSIHMLGYGVDQENPQAAETLAWLAKGRLTRLRRMVSRLNDLGIYVSSLEVLEESGQGVVGRLHLARALYKRRAVQTVREAFIRYLGRGGQVYVDRPRLSPAEAVALIHSLGGIAVMAHPGVLERSAPQLLEPAIEELASVGVEGLEAYYTSHSPELTRRLVAHARARGMIVTGGSDFHRPDPGGPQIGGGTMVTVPPECVETLQARIATRRASPPA